MSEAPQPEEQVARRAKSGSLGAIIAQDFDVMKAVGGVRGIVEAIVPTLLFLVVFMTSRNLMLAIGVAVGGSLFLIGVRALQRIDVTPALGGMFAVLISAFMAWRSGEASDFFVWGLVVNVVYLIAMVVSIIVRWPIVGVLIGLLRGDATSWRKDRAQAVTARRYTLVTWLWAALFGLRALVQIPLYFADATEALGVARLVMGIPLFALVAWFSWMLVRGLPPVDSQSER